MDIVGEIKYEQRCRIGIGQGMNSVVYKSFDPQLGGDFAVKLIDKTMFGGDVTRYFEEAQAMFATFHGNVVPIQSASQNANEIILAMPYFARGSLADRISNAPVTPKEWVRIALGILNGVSQIHTAGYIHFDLKPSNIMFNDTDDPMVADFGQARCVLPGGRVVVPRMYYRAMPPETLSARIGSMLGDIYQVGLLLYRAINGDPVYQAQFVGIDDAAMRQRVIAGRLPDRKLFLPHVPKSIRRIIRKALKLDPAQRYQSAQDFAKTVARVDPRLNWVTTIHASGEMSWKAERTGKSDLEDDLIGAHGGKWNVRAWTVNGTSKRATGSMVLSRSGLDEDEAMDHLNDVFVQLA